jgi:hypothetical protein
MFRSACLLALLACSSAAFAGGHRDRDAEVASDPAAAERHEEVKRLREQIRDLVPAEGTALEGRERAQKKARLTPLVSRLFDLRVERVESRLAADDPRRQKLDEKIADKDALVAKRVEALLNGERPERRRHRGREATPGL